MRKLLYLCLMLIGLVSCSKSELQDYLYLDKGKIVAFEENVAVKVYSDDGKVRIYKVKSFYDRFKLVDLEVGDYVYVYRDDKEVFVTKYCVENAKIINGYFDEWYWNNLGNLWNILIVCVLSCALVFWVVFSHKNGNEEGAKLGIPLLLASMFIIPLIINRVDYKLCYIDEGKITEMYGKMVVINNESYYFVRDTNDIATRNMLNYEDSVFLYSYNSGIFGVSEDVYVSSVYFDDDVINHGNTYPEVFWKTFGIYLLMCIFWGVIFSIKGIYKRI